MQKSSTSERAQIQICRVLCIFFMMSVHVNPGASGLSLFNGGGWDIVGDVWTGFLGHASVATLSFVGGYLLVRTSRNRDLMLVLKQRAIVLLLPMLVWNLVSISMILFKVFVLHKSSGNAFWGDGADYLAAFFGLTGPTANLSLFFLRDMFVSFLLIRVIIKFVEAQPWLVIGITLIIALFDLAEPVVFRPSILFFMVLGSVYALRFPSLEKISSIPVAIIGAVTTFFPMVILKFVPDSVQIYLGDAENLFQRLFLIFIFFAFSAWVTRTSFGEWIRRIEPNIYMSYLMHVPVIGVFWMVWLRFVGDEFSASYAVFFFLAPVVAILSATLFSWLPNHAAPMVQLFLRGKVLAHP